jgi:hypothetical protein
MMTGLGLWAFSKSKWIINGLMLAKGFNMGAKGPGSGGGIMDMLGLGKGSKMLGKSKGLSKIAGLSKFGKLGLGVGSLGAGLAGDFAGGKISDAFGNDDTWQGDIGSTIGSVALGALGSLLGPAGTIAGAALGATLGKTVGDWVGTPEAKTTQTGLNFQNSLKTNNGPEMQDFVMRPGQPATKFTSKDTLIGLKDGGPIEKSFNKENNNNSKTETKIKFDNKLVIEGTIKVDGGGGNVANIDLKNPKILNEISRMIQETIASNINGGKLSPSVS